MDPTQIFQLTRQLIDIQSVSGNEAAIGEFLYSTLQELGFQAVKIPVEGTRFNLYATCGKPAEVVFSTHVDTVPPFIPSREDGTHIYGRGACDTKGIIAAMFAAATRLRQDALPIGVLLVVGEERDSLGARVANDHAPSPRPRFLINGEPTENRVGVASKGALRIELVTRGRMAHSAYPELGESAIEKLLDVLERVRKLPLPTSDVGPTTLNIGIIEGGRAPNVIPDFAKAQLLYRLVGPPDEILAAIRASSAGVAEVDAVLHIPFIRLRTFPDLPTFVAAYTTDIPALSHWGEPILFGPGSIHVAHTDDEHIEKKQLLEAVDIYCSMARDLLT